MTQLIDITVYPVEDVLPILLKDDATGKNIVFATDSYVSLGKEFSSDCCIEPWGIARINPKGFQPRIAKQTEQQAERTRKKAEVFTPAWICCKMNNFCDQEWFDGACPFNVQHETTWRTNSKPIPFPNEKAWQKYVDSRRLEITCGEAPFLVSRYDAATGNLIPVSRRIGILDRKLRVVSENAKTETEWLDWSLRALQSVYGYEMQGDSLLIARINLLATFADFLAVRWNRLATKQELKQAARIISRNIWQMDGLTASVPFFEKPGDTQLTFFDDFELQAEPSEKLLSPRIKNWRGKKILEFRQLIKSRGKDMKFDFVIGNPPYQEQTLGDNKGFAPPVYNLFLEEAYKIADKVEMIHPARFLFNAGSTPKAWNEKMLNDPHFKVLEYCPDASTIFPNTDIKGGVAISFRDINSLFGAIQIFIPIMEMNSVFHKVITSNNFIGINTIAVSGYSYHFTEALYSDHPELIGVQSEGHAYDLKSNVFDKFTSILHNKKPNNKKEYAIILGRENNERKYKYIERRYINDVINFDKYKVLLPKAIGIGAFGEVLPEAVIAEPNTGHTETFFSIGAFKTKSEAINLARYLSTKFARAMLSILKKTQNVTPGNFTYVPLQNFTSNSDIDWSKSIPEIDAQLYKKYKLTKQEITFIESNVKEMN